MTTDNTEMTPEQYAKVKDVFLRVCELPPAQREEVIERELQEDEPLKQEVRSLLQQHDGPAAKLQLNTPRGSAPRTEIVLEDQPPASRKSRVSRSSSSLVDHGRFSPGTILGERFRIVARLGEGGMGEVYRADDLKLGQPVALKFLSEEMLGEQKRLDALYEEVSLARQVSHPNVCRVYDIQEIDGNHFICMEYIDGETLDSLLRRIGRLPEAKAIELARQLCGGLGAVHDRGLLHRDLKPSNVLIDADGHVRLADFGLATLDDGRGPSTAGTPGYLAPEVLAGQGVTVRSEIYSLGLVFYEMFTGQRAYQGDRAVDLLRAQRETDPPPPSQAWESINPAVERIIVQCLEREPEKRPPSAIAVAAALPGGDPLAAALAAGETPSPSLVAAAGAYAQLSPRLAVALGAALILGLVGIMGLADRTLLAPRAGLAKPPEVLAEKARQILADAGYDLAGFQTAWGFDYDDRGVRRRENPELAAERWNQMRQGRHGVIRFWFRASDHSLSPLNPLGRRSPDDPPREARSMTVVLDMRGRLLELDIRPGEKPLGAYATRNIDWTPYFTLAELDPKQFYAAAGDFPPMFAEETFQWYPIDPQAASQKSRVDAAALRNKPVYFRVQTPWVETPRTLVGRGATVGRELGSSLLVVLMVGGAGLAIHNLRSGKGDRSGALKLAVFFFIAKTAVSLLSTAFVFEFDATIAQVRAHLSVNLALAAAAWIYYIALEPYVRRIWPQTLISWTRLMEGHWADPLIGREALIGASFGVWVILAIQLDTLLPGALGLSPGRPIVPVVGEFASLEGTRMALATVLAVWMAAIYMGHGALLMVVMCRWLTKRSYLAIVLPALLYTAVFALQGANPFTSWLIWGVVFFSGMALLVRVGLVAWIVAAMVALALSCFPIGSDFGLWYSGHTVFVLVLVVGIAAYGLLTGLRGSPALRALRARLHRA